MKSPMLLVACLAVAAASPVLARKPANPEYLAARQELATAMRYGDAKAAAVATTGDANSFGRNVKFVGTMQSGVVSLTSDCTPDPAFPPGPDDHCVVPNPAPALTSFSFADVGRVLIPGKSVNSLICHWQTPFVVYGFRNTTGVYQPNARFVVTPTYKIENAVLNDPTLIDPSTGLPFNGSFTVGLSGIRDSRSLQPGEAQTLRENATRVCLGGIVSKQALMEGYGLTAAQATNFFKNDTIITMNLTGQAALIDFASIIYGVRFVGD